MSFQFLIYFLDDQKRVFYRLFFSTLDRSFLTFIYLAFYFCFLKTVPHSL